MSVNCIKTLVRRFRRDEDGVALVEFAIFLPLFLLSFFVIVEFSRVFFSYQGAVVGVRDAARYLARVAPEGICSGAANGSGGVLVFSNPDGNGGFEDAALQIVRRNMDNEYDVLPEKITIQSVTSTYVCVVPPAGTYRQNEVPIAQVAAQVEIELPLGGILTFNGLQLIPNITHTVTDQSRIFGV
ncbi:MAG: TadE/TadG family type IV pilus assembly protein [Boseongicola sp.]